MIARRVNCELMLAGRRVKSESGFSLPEMMAVVAIMVLATMLLATGLPSAFNAYAKSVDTANADLLLSTTAERLREVLGDADPAGEIKTGPISAAADNPGQFAVVTFMSAKTGRRVSILHNNGTQEGIYVWECAVDPVTKAITYSNDPTPLVPQKAGAGNKSTQLVAVFKNAGSAITYDNGVFTVHQYDVKKVPTAEDPNSTVLVSLGNVSKSPEEPALKVRTIASK